MKVKEKPLTQGASTGELMRMNQFIVTYEQDLLSVALLSVALLSVALLLVYLFFKVGQVENLFLQK